MLTEKQTKKIFLDTKALLQGHFILSSGLHSEYYLQCAKLLMHPKHSESVCKSLSKKIRKVFKKIDLIVVTKSQPLNKINLLNSRNRLPLKI